MPSSIRGGIPLAKWTTTSAVAWSTAMMLLLASPAAALGSDDKAFAGMPEARAVMAGASKTMESKPVQLLSLLPSGEASMMNEADDKAQNDAKAEWDKLQRDPELQKLQGDMKQLREQMHDLREKRLMLIAKKLGITTEGKTVEQIRDEISQKLGGKKHLFHGKHVDKEARMQHLQKWSQQNGVDQSQFSAEELNAKLQEWKELQSDKQSQP